MEEEVLNFFILWDLIKQNSIPSPVGVKFNSKFHLFVCSKNIIKVFDENIFEIFEFGEFANGWCNLCFDKFDRILVTESNGDSLKFLNADGELERKFLLPKLNLNQRNCPYGIDISNNDEFIIADNFQAIRHITFDE